jgi:hypothetical protein
VGVERGAAGEVGVLKKVGGQGDEGCEGCLVGWSGAGKGDEVEGEELVGEGEVVSG